MARHKARYMDDTRTEMLAINELFVLKGKGDETHFYTWLADDRPDSCPICGSINLKTQNRFSRTYIDCFDENEKTHIIYLIYGFYKFRCMNPECHHIFTPPITFASANDNVTYRLEDTIAGMVIDNKSYAEIATILQDKLSRQAIGQIFNRWVQTRNERRKPAYVPRVMGIVTGCTEKGHYTLTISCDKGIRVLDIQYGIDSQKIITSLQKFSGEGTDYIVSDCDPTVYSSVKEALPKATHIIPAEMWLRLVRNDFKDLARVRLKWVQIKDKLAKVMEAKAEDEENLSLDLRRIFTSRKDLFEPYNDYQYLRDRITDRNIRWTIEELDEWPETIDNTFKQAMSISLLQYREYRSEIAAQQEHRDIIPNNLLSATDRLEELIQSRRTFSEEALQAAVLYSNNEDLKNWQGVDIEVIISKLLWLQEHSRRNKHDYE